MNGIIREKPRTEFYSRSFHDAKASVKERLRETLSLGNIQIPPRKREGAEETISGHPMESDTMQAVSMG